MPAFLAGPLLKYAIMALVVAALCGTIYVYHLKLTAADAKVAELQAQLSEATAANKGLADQVTQLTSDAKKAADQAKADHDALIAQQTKAETVVTQIQKEIERVAVASDSVCSPALAAAFGRVCPVANSNDHSAATDRKAEAGPGSSIPVSASR